MKIILKTGALGTGTFSEKTKTTTTAAVQTIDTIAVPTGQAILLQTKLISRKDDFTEKGGFDMEAVYCNNAGTVSLQGVVTNLFKQAQAGYAVTLVISGTNVLVRVASGAAINVDWKSQTTTIPV